MSERPGFSEHKVMLCLNKTLYRAFIKLQADKELGRSYAGLLPWIEGMYHLGYLSREEYEVNVKKYSQPLTEKAKVESREAIEERQLLESKDKIFQGMIDQFHLHATKPSWCSKVSKDAERFRDRLDSARTLLTMIEGVKGKKATVQ